MEKFENGIFEYSDPKKTPSLVEIENAYRRAKTGGAEKFAVVINGEYFGYNPQKRGIFKLPKGEYQVFPENTPLLREKESPVDSEDGGLSALTIDEDDKGELETVELPEIVSAATEETAEIEETPVEVENEPVSDETTESNVEPTEEETDEDGATEGVEQQSVGDVFEELGIRERTEAEKAEHVTGIIAENVTLKKRVEELEGMNRLLASECGRNRKVVEIVLEMNAKIIAALK
jgi:flagellar motility protein MotE (MotC chaperone)